MIELKDRRNGVQLQYIFDNIDLSDKCNYEKIVEPTEPAERVKMVLDCFNEEHNCQYEKHRQPVLQNRIEDWLRGLPTVLSIEFCNYKIIELGNSWGVLNSVRKFGERGDYVIGKREANFIDNYWSVCAWRLLQLAKIYKVDTNYLQ